MVNLNTFGTAFSAQSFIMIEYSLPNFLRYLAQPLRVATTEYMCKPNLQGFLNILFSKRPSAIQARKYLTNFASSLQRSVQKSAALCIGFPQFGQGNGKTIRTSTACWDFVCLYPAAFLILDHVRISCSYLKQNKLLSPIEQV